MGSPYVPLKGRQGAARGGDAVDHNGAGDLHQRDVGGVLEPRLRIRLPDIPYCAIIGDIGVAIRPNRTLIGRLNPRTPSGKASSKALLYAKRCRFNANV